MLQTINLKKLFGRFNYSLTMKSDGVTIITGPNGFGKSTILKIIEAIWKRNIRYFFQLDFEAITVFCDGTSNIEIIKDNRGENLTFSYNKISTVINYNAFQSDIRIPSWLRRLGPNKWRDIRNGTIVTGDDIYFLVEREDEQLFLFENSENSNGTGNNLQTIFEKAKTHIGEVRLISEQRLIREEFDQRNEEKRVVEVINDLPKKLMIQIAETANKYSTVANKLDSSYPKRLLSANNGLENEKAYTHCLDEARPKFDKLRKYDLANITLLEAGKYNAKYSEALKIYFEDFSEKYKVFEVLIDKFEIFTKIVNERLTFKEVKISREKGIEVIDSTNQKKALNLRNLSSGEKQEIVLFYELIFETNSELLLLIDEPEISLHIAWQKKFLDDLLMVVKKSNIQVVVATHSPQIVGNHWDINIDLGELYGK